MIGPRGLSLSMVRWIRLLYRCFQGLVHFAHLEGVFVAAGGLIRKQKHFLGADGVERIDSERIKKEIGRW